MKAPNLKWNHLIASFFIIALISLAACSKSDEVINTEEPDSDPNALTLKVNVAADEATAADAFDEVEDIAEEALEAIESFLPLELKAGNGNGNGGHQRDTLRPRGPRQHRLAECALITRDVNETQDTVVITIDYGTECETQDGKIRSGKIIITRIGERFWTGTTTSTTSFEDYVVDGKLISGSKTVSSFMNEAENREQNIEIVGQVVLPDDEGVISWSASRVREVVEGSDTRIKLDDVIHVTGSSSGVSADGSVFTSEIVEALVRIHEEGCFGHYVSGITQITRGADTEITINYGDGTCDNLAEVTTNGETETVELGKKRPRF